MRYGAWWASVCLVVGLAGCSSGDGETPAPSSTPATSVEPAVARVPANDPGALREAAALALADQRLYAPAGDNAVEHYLALRALSPSDTSVETALLELMPYALIGSEQAIARGDFAEARRRVALVERADAGLPALVRLRDRLVAAEVEAAAAAERAAREAEAAARREEDAARLAEAQAAGPSTTPPPTPTPPLAAAPAPAAVVARPAQPTASAPPAAPTPAPTPLPKLVNAPPPRYPALALRRKVEGDVVLELRIAADGQVAEARVLSATAPGVFEDAAVAAARRWRFEPGGVAVTTRQVLRFRLPDRD